MEIKVINNESYFGQVQSLLAKGKSVKIPVKGNSMHPFLKEGDQVLLKERNVSDLKWGCIVLAIYDDTYVLHRFIGFRDDFVELVGDHNLAQKERVSMNDVIARLEAVYRDGKYVDVYSGSSLLKAWIWYKIRPLRYVYRSIVNKLKLGK